MKRVLSMLLLAMTVGCATVEDQARQETEHKEDMDIMQDKINKLQGRIEGLEIEQQRIEQQLDALPKSTASQIDALQTHVTDLDTRVHALDASREKDKQDIIDKLSGKI